MITAPKRFPMLQLAWPRGDNGIRTCPGCNKPWRPWAGSYLPCHGKCLFTPEGAAAIRASALTEDVLAAELGVTISVVRSVRGRR